ncbi:hypothetical protein BDQ12DRAFT_293915 [Crucibulum laeve]|uniref:PHD-type domain-containing protein n=1 Tax=Crucibulum laeve TaxID=68775 RepID=A0A5C3MDH8_9AGAR|nr:hypothetical protein BDQ12DRAFT_293915 [Crucibulum laeve]
MASTASMPAYMLPGVPVHQPPHLEGDASLATEILPGPPSLVSAQQAAQKRDPKKPSTLYSYLPHSDPGSTYSGIMHGTLIGQEPEGPRTKRARVDKGTAASRAQRASARSQNGAMSVPDLSVIAEASSDPIAHPIQDSDSYTMVLDDDVSISRSNSSQNLMDAPTTSSRTRSRRKEKGKGKEIDPTLVKVKEEPKTVSLLSPEPPSNLLNNDDHCSSCQSLGALVYCDGCPRAFHLWCLDPPMEGVDEGDDSRWFCPACRIKKNPPRKPPQSLLSPLIYQIETSIPVEFQLPDEVRTFFKDVGTGPKGSYVDSSEVKQLRLNRHGQMEDRDPCRLRDRNGLPILCFKCGTSALPGGLTATTPTTKQARRSTSKATTPEAWRSMVSCDYCNLHWHLDCLDPPLPTMPPYNKKWMCPNHSERILPSKRRIPKQNVSPIEITKPRLFNNGNIEVTQPETPSIAPNPSVNVDEVLINGRRYRVPERIIVLDFWNKLNKSDQQLDRDMDVISAMSSPLTSLSSLEDLEDRIIPDSELPLNDNEVAQMLCRLKSGKAPIHPPVPTPSVAGSSRKKKEDSIPRPEVIPKPQPRIKAPRASRTKSALNGKVGASSSVLSEAVPITPSAATGRRKRIPQTVQPEPSTRELRSRSRNIINTDSPMTSISSRVRSPPFSRIGFAKIYIVSTSS